MDSALDFYYSTISEADGIQRFRVRVSAEIFLLELVHFTSSVFTKYWISYRNNINKKIYNIFIIIFSSILALKNTLYIYFDAISFSNDSKNGINKMM